MVKRAQFPRGQRKYLNRSYIFLEDILPYTISILQIEIGATVTSTSHVRAFAMLFLSTVGNYKWRSCAVLERNNVHIKFRENRSTVSKLKGDTQRVQWFVLRKQSRLQWSEKVCAWVFWDLVASWILVCIYCRCKRTFGGDNDTKYTDIFRYGSTSCHDAGDSLQIRREAAKMLNKQSRKIDKGCSSDMGVGCGFNSPSTEVSHQIWNFERHELLYGSDKTVSRLWITINCSLGS